MPRTPDPSYWGNPPRTPQARKAAAQTPSQPPQPPAAEDASAPCGSAPAPDAGEPADERKHRTRAIALIVIACLAAALLMAGGCALGRMALDRFIGDPLQPDDTATALDGGFSRTDELAAANERLRTYYGIGWSDEGISDEELMHIDGILAGSPGSSDAQNDAHSFSGSDEAEGVQPSYAHRPGVYRVGEDVPAGRYFFDGSEGAVRSFAILTARSEQDASGHVLYDVTLENEYYDHSMADLGDGDVLIADAQEGFAALDEVQLIYQPPYSNGVYRVGEDIPAGTYELALGDAPDYSMACVMDDLAYTRASIIESRYFLHGDDPGYLTLEEGTYLELYNMMLIPADE